jgi:S1-C subfamily serine protease
MLIKLAQSSEKKPKTTLLTYQKVEGASQNPNRRFRVFLGTIPDYVQEKVKGVKISGTSKDSPAEKAGLKAGDVIISVDQVSIDNLYDYVYVLQALKPKQPVQLKFVRQGKSYEVSVTPQLRE